MRVAVPIVAGLPAILLAIPLTMILMVSGCAGRPAAGADAESAAVVESRARQLGNLVLHQVPDLPAALVEGVQRYRNARSALLMGWLDDGVLVATRFAETQQLHRVRTPLAARDQLTFFAEPVAEAFVPPDPGIGGFVYLRDTGGSEFYQMFWFDLGTSSSRQLSDGRSRYTNVVWSNRSDRFAYVTTERNGRDWDIHTQTLAGRRVPVLEAGGTGWGIEDWSPDDQQLLVSRYVSINEVYLYELSLITGALTPLLDADIRTGIGQARYARDRRGVYFTSDLGAEFRRLHFLDLDSGAIEVLTAEIPWDVELFDVSADGEYLAYSTNEDGLSRLTVVRLPDRRQLALPQLPAGVLSALKFNARGDRVALTLGRPTAPDDVYSVELGGRTLTRWTRSEVGGLNTDDMVEPELIEYPTFDLDGDRRRRIPAFVYRPAGPGPHPVYLSIHGGPESQYRPRFSAALQYYVRELGMAVVVPNVRGSSGYGKTYLKLDDGRLREDSVADIGALLDWIEAQPDLDPRRVVVSGGSYGGYMVLAALERYPDRLAGGIERFGISNFVTFLHNTEDYRRDLRRAEYGDERDPEMRAFLERISPLNGVHRIARPLLIFQGANDPRVPASESAQIYAALRERGVPVWYVLARDEGHGFRKKTNSDYAAAATALFLDALVLDGANGVSLQTAPENAEANP
ncbi:MAG: alpha/beta fold hydrolase [Pseudomonadales bacterium]